MTGDELQFRFARGGGVIVGRLTPGCMLQGDAR